MNKTVRPFRRDAIDKVTGAAKYSGDFQLDGMLHIKVVWPKQYPALIEDIDCSKASAYPGVVRVITRKDIAGPNLAAVFEPYDRPVLTGKNETVQFGADAVALVVAKTEDIAERATELVEVKYKPVHAVHSIDQAIEEGNTGFINKHIEKGDVTKGFNMADAITEDTYTIPFVEHAYLEPEAGYAYTDNDGTINLCYGSQNLGRHHRMICKSLGLPFHKVHISAPYIGGAFGGKQSYSVQVYLALAELIVKQPVRLVWTREESMMYGCKRHYVKAHAKMGMTKEGKICAYQVKVESAAAPYRGYTPNTLDFFSRYLCGPYRHENLLIDGNGYFTTGAEAGAYRGFGGPDATFVTETLINRTARKLGLDPLEVRRINWMEENEEFDQQFENAPWRNMSATFAIQKTMEKALEAAGKRPKASSGKKVGRGYANAIPCFCIGNTPGYKGTTADLVMFIDGTLLVRLGYPEAGQGLSGAAIEFASECMELPKEKINLMLCDTHLTPKAGSLGFSQATVNAGNAIVAASKNLKKVLADIAREYLKTDDQSIHYSKGDFYNGNGDLVLKWEDISDYCYYEGKNLTASGSTVPPDINDRHGVTPISAVADVEVDEETGEVKVLQIINCHDSGRVMHYGSARGQMIGGAVMAFGNTLMEEYIVENGVSKTPSFAEYLIPTSMDIPEHVGAEFVENPGEDCPLGAKGMGEHPLYATGAAIANAILDATGIEVNQTPITSEYMLRKMKKI